MAALLGRIAESSRRLQDFLRGLIVRKKPVESDDWGIAEAPAATVPEAVPAPASVPVEKPQKQKKVEAAGWEDDAAWSAPKGHVPGPRTVKRVMAMLLTVLYAAVVFLIPMDSFSAGLVLTTIYILLDYVAMTRS